ncbi:hypothetical protein [Phytohabitans rumicis]|uniref:Uncharacterized protein n=1 Tax=Phytohabitans rumicis TaxID=1076125 RepID=A0A6V8L261_9ACTN|nr:hypothetical protein [Phytohabitans rumicis]GFJ88196.1 hypothetical protein Prum_018380 [Phytohabitans rumicis]
MEATFSRRLIVGGRSYEITAAGADAGPIALRVVGHDRDGRVVAEVTGELAPDELPVLADVVTSTLAGLVAMTHTPARRRHAHPNHGARWAPDDDERLVTRYRGGASIPDLMKEFGRNRGGIRSRLVHLGEISAEPRAA